MDVYLHGIDTIEANNGPRPTNTIDTGVIGALVTAPDASPSLPRNFPILVNGYDGFPEGLGDTGTAKDVLTGIFDQAGRASQTIVMGIVDEGANAAATMANLLGSASAYTGYHLFRRSFQELGVVPKLLVGSGFTGSRPTDGLVSINLTNQGTGYTSAPTVAITGGGGVGASAEAIINSTTGKVTEVVLRTPGANFTSAPTVTITGGGGTGATATATVGTVANPLTKGLLSIAPRLRACVIKDGPNTTTTAAVTDRNDYDTDRMLIVDPFVKVSKNGAIVQQPASARVAGLQARVDYEEGFWCSASNHEIQNIVGIARPIEHTRGDPASESNFLNQRAISTIVRGAGGGFKLWGSRVPSSDPLNVFLSVRRAHDTIITAIEIASEVFVDKPFSVQNLSDLAETVNAALRRWQAMGATLGGRVWFDRKLNTKETWASGHLFVSYDAEGPAPMEQITFIFNRNTGYYEQLADAAIAEVARLNGV